MKLLAGLGYVGSKPSGSFYLTGNQGSNWPYKPNSGKGLFRDIDPRVLNDYRQNSVRMRTVQLTGVVATHINDVDSLIKEKNGYS